MSVKIPSNLAYGFNQALTSVFPEPIKSLRNPTASDKTNIGRLWINTAAPAAYVLVSIVNNLATWENISGGGGAFATLTVNPGPTNITGTTNINTAGLATTTIGNGAVFINLNGIVMIAGSLVNDGGFTQNGGVLMNVGTANTTSIGSLGTGQVLIGNTTGNTAVTGTLTTSGNITVTAGGATITGTTNINTNGAAITTIGTGGTGNVAIGNATGNTTVTGQLTASAGIMSTSGVIGIGPVAILQGAGAPAGGLAIAVGDMYINTTSASATTRLYIATAVGTWTNVTCAA